jgi:hypothetical protein
VRLSGKINRVHHTQQEQIIGGELNEKKAVHDREPEIPVIPAMTKLKPSAAGKSERERGCLPETRTA